MPNWLTRFSDFASKAAPPAPGSLFSPRPQHGYAGTGVYPMAFPGWPDRTGSGAQSPEMRSRTALMSAWVYSDVQVIARRFSTGIIQVERKKQETETEVVSHPLETIWLRPNFFMGRAFMMQFWTFSILAGGKGDAYIFSAPGPDGTPAEFWPVPPGMIKPVGNETEFISHYEFKSRPDSKPIDIDPAYIIYSRLPNPFDLRLGLDPLLALSMAVETDLAKTLWNKNFFGKRNAIPTALATLPAHTSGPDFDRIKQDIFDFFGGGKREVAVTRSGDLDFKILSYNAEQMQFAATRELSRDEIDRALGIPQGYWTAAANRANSDHADAVIDNHIAWPLLVMLAEDINAQHVARWYGEDEVASFEDIRSEDVELKRNEINSRKDYATVDELRAMDGMEPIGDERGHMLVEQAKTYVVVTTPKDEATDEDDATAGATQGAQEEHTPTQAESAAADIKRWQDKALKRLRGGKSAAVPFTSDAISASDHARISKGLESCKTAADVRRVFSTNSDLASAARELAAEMRAARETLEKTS